MLHLLEAWHYVQRSSRKGIFECDFIDLAGIIWLLLFTFDSRRPAIEQHCSVKDDSTTSDVYYLSYSRAVL